MNSVSNYTVVGTSVGALAVAAELALKGRSVTLSARPQDVPALERLAARPSLHVLNEASNWGTRTGSFDLKGIVYQPDLRDAITGADAIVLMMPPNFHDEVLAPCADLLRNDQAILLCPGGLGGALLISRLAAAHSAPDILVAQVSSMPHVAHTLPDDGIRVTVSKKTLPIGVFPALRTQEFLDRFAADFPSFSASANVIENGLSTAALGLHPAPMIMNATQIEQKGPYVYDGYDITPAIARVIEAVDAERQEILRTIGGRAYSFADSLIEAYGVTGANLYEVVHNVGGYKQAMSPPDLDYRYLSEDIPTQAVPAALLARALGLATPMLDALVSFANAIHGTDHWKDGWTLERLGLSGLDPIEIIEFVRTGKRTAIPQLPGTRSGAQA